jgi:hypothetical protein
MLGKTIGPRGAMIHLILPVMRLYDQVGPVTLNPLQARIRDSIKMAINAQEKELQIPGLETRGQKPFKNPADPSFQIRRL